RSRPNARAETAVPPRAARQPAACPASGPPRGSAGNGRAPAAAAGARGSYAEDLDPSAVGDPHPHAIERRQRISLGRVAGGAERLVVARAAEHRAVAIPPQLARKIRAD